MKKLKLTGCVLLVCGMFQSSFGQTKDVTINGTLTNMKEMPAKIYLVYIPILNLKTDSAQVANGKYKITGSTGGVVSGATLTTNLKAKNNTNTTQIILDKGELNLNSNGDLQHTEVSGSASAAQLEYENILKPFRDTAAILRKQQLSEQFKTDEAFKKQVQAGIMQTFSFALKALFDYPLSHPNSKLTPYMTWSSLNGASTKLYMIDSLQRNLPAGTPEVYKSAIAAIRDKTAKADADFEAKVKANDEKLPLGSKAMDFTMNNTKGQPVSLSSFRGKYVLIDFWASWCGPCRGENPNVVKAYNTYKDKGFTVLGVSLDGEAQKAAWLAAIKKDGLAWTQVSDLKGWKNDAAKLYMVEAIPKNFLVDPNGIIIGKNLRGKDLTDKLASIFNK